MIYFDWMGKLGISLDKIITGKAKSRELKNFIFKILMLKHNNQLYLHLDVIVIYSLLQSERCGWFEFKVA